MNTTGITGTSSTLPKIDPMKNKTPMFRFAMLEVATTKNIRDSATGIMNNIADTQRAKKSESVS